MARLADLLARAARGEPGLALVSGEAGVGKSGVVRELRTRARDAGFTALVGTTLESDAWLPYASFVSAIRSAYGQPDRLRKSLTSSTPDLVPLFPELGQGSDQPERRHRDDGLRAAARGHPAGARAPLRPPRPSEAGTLIDALVNFFSDPLAARRRAEAEALRRSAEATLPA